MYQIIHKDVFIVTESGGAALEFSAPHCHIPDDIRKDEPNVSADTAISSSGNCKPTDDGVLAGDDGILEAAMLAAATGEIISREVLATTTASSGQVSCQGHQGHGSADGTGTGKSGAGHIPVLELESDTTAKEVVGPNSPSDRNREQSTETNIPCVQKVQSKPSLTKLGL